METSRSSSPGRHRRQAAVLFGEVLRVQRERVGLSQAGLADRAGLSTDFVSRLERGERQPGLESLLRLGAVLGLPAGRLVDAVEAGWVAEP